MGIATRQNAMVHKNNGSEFGSLKRKRCNNNGLNRQVHFEIGSENEVINADNDAMTSVVRSDLWWSTEDYAAFRNSILSIAARIHLQTKTFEPQYVSYSNCLARVFGSLVTTSRLRPMDEIMLQNWIHIGETRRGLERWSAPELSAQRKQLKNMAIQGVIRMQRHFPQNMNYLEKSERLRILSEKFSKPACKFAIEFGKGDEVAAKNEYKRNLIETNIKLAIVPGGCC